MYSEEGRVIHLDVFPKDYEGDGHGTVILSVLDRKSYRSDLTVVPERLKLDTGYGGTHASYKLKDGAVSTKTMTKLLDRVRKFVEEKVSHDRRATESHRQQMALGSVAVQHMTAAGYACGEVTKPYGSGATFKATKDGAEVEVETSGGNKVKVSLYLSSDHRWCRVEMAPDFCDELIRHHAAMEALDSEDADRDLAEEEAA
jgi:hypothetical protein